MFTLAVIVSLLLIAGLVFSGLAKIRGNETVGKSMQAVGFPDRQVPLLAIPLFAGALGLLIGIFWAPLGIAAAIGVVVYFVLAAGAHLRVSDFPGLVGPGVFLLLGVLALIFRSVSA